MQLTFIQFPNDKMDKEYFIKLTSRLYRLTLFFPQDDPLKLRMRKLGADVLANLIFMLEGAFYQSRELINNTQKDIEALNCFFGVVKTLDWVHSSDLLEIQKEYSKIKEELKKISEIQSLKIGEIHTLQLETEKKEMPAQKTLLEGKAAAKEEEGLELSQLEKRFPRKKVSSKNSLQRRQQRILEILKERGKAQVGDFKKIFPSVSKRTLRRDFKDLTDNSLVERIGEKNDTFYQFLGRTDG